MDGTPIHEPYHLRGTSAGTVAVPFKGDVEDWLRRLEVYTPFDADRRRDLDRWKHASAEEKGAAFLSLLSIVDAMEGSIPPKPPLRVCFPQPYRGPTWLGQLFPAGDPRLELFEDLTAAITHDPSGTV